MRTQSLVVLIAIALLASVPLIAQADPILVFTEESPTVLDVTLGGVAYGSVSLISPDNWYWTFPAAPFSIGTIETILPAWTERDTKPGSEFGTLIEGEFINPTPGPDPTFATGGLLIESEHSFAQINDGPLSPMGSIVDPDVKFFFNGGSTEVFGVEFNEVPDTSPTIVLAGMAFAGLVSVRRCLRPVTRAA